MKLNWVEYQDRNSFDDNECFFSSSFFGKSFISTVQFSFNKFHFYFLRVFFSFHYLQHSHLFSLFFFATSTAAAAAVTAFFLFILKKNDHVNSQCNWIRWTHMVFVNWWNLLLLLSMRFFFSFSQFEIIFKEKRCVYRAMATLYFNFVDIIFFFRWPI